jgi:serine/threonine-protein kinase
MQGFEADASRERPAEDALIGKVVNERFHIVRRIARGGMGSVYFATQAPLSRPVALKVLHTAVNIHGEAEESFRRRFLLEASILARLQHPNIVMLFDYGQITDLATEHCFMAMEYLRGETLAQRFRAQGRLSILESLRLARQIGRGLREAHRCGFIHRDLKPSNIMLVPDDERNDIVKLIDFGIGKIIPAGSSQAREGADETQAGLLLGSPRYMSPEQIRSEAVEPRTDLYGLGITLFEALTGRVPFDSGTKFDVMVSHCLVEPPTLSEACNAQAYPESLCKLVAALLEKQPTDRPTVDEFLRQLTAVEDDIFHSVTLTAAGSPMSPAMPFASSDTAPTSEQGSRRRITVRPAAPFFPVARAAPGAPSSLAPFAPSQRPPGRRRAAAVRLVLLVAALLALVPLGRYVLRGVQGRISAAVQSSASSAAPGAALHSSASGPMDSVSPVATFDVTIDSSPSGARVTEGGKAIGTTPTTISIDRATVKMAPRYFSIDLDGYAPYALQEGDSEAPVHLVATLTLRHNGKLPVPRATGPVHLDGELGALPAGADSARAKREEGTGLDIRLRR